MELIPESREALDELDPGGREGALGDGLQEMAARVREIVPDCVGLSVGYRRDGLVFTLVASAGDLAVLDAMQYLFSGPCVAAVEDGGDVVETTQQDLMDEPSWRLLGHVAAARGIESTLTLPIMSDDEAVGSVNLYAATASAFIGLHEDVAAAVGGWAGGAVTNADLSFDTRRRARQAPQRLRDRHVVDAATGLLAARYDLPIGEARSRLADAAAQAGVPEVEIAIAILDSHTSES